jgi:uncharacterized OsmC-like protein
VEKDDGVLVIRRIHVAYHLKADLAHKEAVEWVHGLHADKCPVYRTLSGCIDISTEVLMEA